ncbi:MAG TPA: PepSY-associated TM helix domain-containing protein [Polyangiaceae bacterium]|jgi:hypothetical protein
MAEGGGAKRRSRIQWRALLRAVHRDVGYAAVGLTFVYAVSGLAVNHVAQWDPNFVNSTTTHELGAPLPDDDEAAKAMVLSKLGITDTPREVYREGDELEVLFEHRTLHVTVANGHVIDEGQKPRFFVRAANWLHLNRGKKAWTYFADSYAAGLLFLATSGLFMIAGKKGLWGRGVFFVAAGVAIPLVYLALVKG